MAENSTDVMMRIVSNGRAMQAESRTEFVFDKLKDDTLRFNFETGYFCDLKDFSFSAGVESPADDDDEDDEKDGDDTDPAAKRARQRRARLRRRRREAARAHLPAVIDAQPTEYTRIFDSASTLLFQALVTCETLDSISIIKRKSAGSANAGEVFLRLDFDKVLMTDLDWKDSEHIIEETGTFIYRNLKIRYRPQKPDGTLGVAIPMQWPKK